MDAMLEIVNKLIVTVILLAIARADRKRMVIPDKLTASLLLPILLSLCIPSETSLVSRIAGFFVVSVPMFLMTLAVPGSFGGGDIKLIAVGGLLLGVRGTLLAAFLSVVTGGIYAIFLLAAKKIDRKGHFAFGPFLAFGIWVSMMYYKPIMGLYAKYFQFW